MKETLYIRRTVRKYKPKKGRVRLYVCYLFRRGSFSVKLPGTPDSQEFWDAYWKHRRTTEQPDKKAPTEGTFNWLFNKYLASNAFKTLAENSQRTYILYIDLYRKLMGTDKVSAFKTHHVYQLLEKWSDKPARANTRIATLAAVYKYGVRFGHCDFNPCSGVERLKTGPTRNRPWNDLQIAAFRKAHPIGSKERTVFELLLNTGQRLGDVTKMQRHHIKKDGIEVIQEKTGTRVLIPISKALKPALDAWLASHEHLALFVGAKGQPATVNVVQRWMDNAKAKCGVEETNHGLRFTAARILYDLGVEPRKIRAVTGHRAMKTLEIYLEQERGAKAAIEILDRSEK